MVPDEQGTTAAQALFNDVFLQYRFPAVLQSDQGGEWLNAVLRQLTKLLSVEHIVTTSYHPRLNGSTERVHRWFNAAIGIHCEKHQEEFLQLAVYSHNVSPIPGTGQICPFFLVFGCNAPSPEVISLELPEENLPRSTYAKQLVSRMHEAHKQFNSIKASIKRTQREYFMINHPGNLILQKESKFMLADHLRVQNQKDQPHGSFVDLMVLTLL